MDWPDEDQLIQLLEEQLLSQRADITANTLPINLDPATQRRLEADREVLDLLAELWQQPQPSHSANFLGHSRFPFQFGRFQILHQLGAGGCGVVLLANDTRLHRPVALKVPHPFIFRHEEYLRRFEQEAKAAAFLSHPNIIPVHEFGDHDGVPYIASEYCTGPDLASWLRSRSEPIPVRDAVIFIVKLSQAMGYTHGCGIVHRDLKPGNILLDGAADVESAMQLPLTQLVPRITDFGFARQLESDECSLSHTGQVIGTPSYMSPEQAQGDRHRIGASTDVYALGAIFYELLTGQQPLRGKTTPETIQLILSVEPSRPRLLRREIHRDLEAVCLKSLHKNPDRRYRNGRELADDLERWLNNKPTQARPVSTLETTWKWTKRNPLWAAMLLVTICAFSAILALSWRHQLDLESRNLVLQAAVEGERLQKEEAIRLRELAQQKTVEAKREQYVAEMRRVASQLANENERHQLNSTHVGDWRPIEGRDIRGFEWYYFRRMTDRISKVLPAYLNYNCIAISDNGRFLALLLFGHGMQVWDLDTSTAIAKWDALKFSGNIAVSPDGNSIVVLHGGNDRYYVSRGQKNGDVETNKSMLDKSVQLYPYFVNHDNFLVPIWNRGFGIFRFSDGASVGQLPDASAHGIMAAINRRENLAAIGIITAKNEKCIVLYRISDWQEIHRWELPHIDGRMALTSDAKHLVTWTRIADFHEVGHNDIYIYSVPDGKLKSHWCGPDKWHNMYFDAVGLDNGEIAAYSWKSVSPLITIERWSPKTGKWSKEYFNAGCPVAFAKLRPDGRSIVVASHDNTIRIQSLSVSPYIQRDVSPHFEAWAVAVSPDSRTIVTGGDDHKVRIWSLDDGLTNCNVLNGHESLVTVAKFDPSGRWFATGSFDETVRIWDARSGKPIHILPFGNKVRAIDISPDGHFLAASGNGRFVKIWDMKTGNLLNEIDLGVNQETLTHEDVLFAKSGSQVIVALGADRLAWWDTQSGQQIRSISARRAASLAKVGDGTTFLCACDSGVVEYRKTETGELIYEKLGYAARQLQMTVDSTGKTAAISSDDGSLRLWNIATGIEIGPLLRKGPQVNGVAFAPNGSFLVAVRHDGKMILWPTRDLGLEDRGIDTEK